MRDACSANPAYCLRNVVLYWISLIIWLPLQTVSEATPTDMEVGKVDPVIYAIEVIGNRVTKTNLILREMRLKPGMIATPKAIELDRMNIESLGLFNRVQIRIAEDADRAVLQVQVTEPFYIYPYLLGRYNVTKPDHTVFGMGVYHYNFRGQGQKLNISAWGGYARGLLIYHEDSWYSIAGKYGLNGRIYYSDDEITDPMDQKVRRRLSGIRLSIKRRLGFRHHIELGTGWKVIDSESDDYTLTPGNRDRVWSLQLEHKNDKRDYRYYPRKGFYIFIIAEANRLVDHAHNFFREMIDIRSYGSLSRFTLALRGWGEFGQYTLPFYSWLGVGRSQVRAGEGFSNPRGYVIGSNIELRFNIIKPFYYNLEEVPLAGPYLRDLRFALEGVLFADRGFYFSHRSGLRNDFRAIGFGIQAQVPYIKVAHILLGWAPETELGEPSITIRNGVTF